MDRYILTRLSLVSKAGKLRVLIDRVVRVCTQSMFLTLGLAAILAAPVTIRTDANATNTTVEQQDAVDPAHLLAESDPIRSSFLLNPVVQRVLWFSAQQMKNDPTWVAQYNTLRDTLHQHPETFVQQVFSNVPSDANALSPRAERSSMASLPPSQFLEPPAVPFGLAAQPQSQGYAQAWASPQLGGSFPAALPQLGYTATPAGQQHAALPFDPR